MPVIASYFESIGCPASVAAMTTSHKAHQKAAACIVAVPLPFGDAGSRKGVTRFGDWASTSKTCNDAKVAKCLFAIGRGMESRFLEALLDRRNRARGFRRRR